MKPVILVMPDCFTSLGGNQYVDSQVLGNWSTWLRTDLKQEIQSRFNCSNKFGLFGKSSGGFGSIYNALDCSRRLARYSQPFWRRWIRCCLS